jgi:hypothetical protein
MDIETELKMKLRPIMEDMVYQIAIQMPENPVRIQK